MSRQRTERAALTDTAELRAHAFESDLRLAVVADIARALSAQLTEEQLLDLVMERLTHALDAERSTLFLVGDGDVLYSKVAQGEGSREIRLSVGQGLAGWVAATQRGVNVKDAYQDPRFDPRWDQETGFRTRSMICQPVIDREGELLGVVQVLNKQEGWFTVDDEGLLHTIMAMTAIALVNQRLHATLIVQNLELAEIQRKLADRVNEIDLLYRLERETTEAADLDEVMDAVVQRLARTVPASVVEVALVRPGDGLALHRYARPARNGDGRASGPVAVVARLVLPAVSGLVGRAIAGGATLDLAELVPARLAQLAAEEDLPFVPRAGRCVPLADEDRVLGALAVYDHPGKQLGLDGTEAKLLELVATQAVRAVTLRQKREQAELQDRLSAIGRALAGILHDLRTPMTVASGAVQLLKSEDDPTERAALADQVMRQLGRMIEMSREVLAFARGDARALYRKVLVQDFARDAEEVVKQVFARTAATVAVTCSDHGFARIDATKLLRVVQNIARNARDVLAEHQDGRFALGIAADGQELVLTFADNGPGVPEAFRHRMFDAFATAGKKDGTGLGLAMVKQFAEAHGGTVSYRDTDGGGATFEIRIQRESHDSGEPVRDSRPTPVAGVPVVREL
jgi:signal transduction histidine kinase/putative methionine-R-sulfoxide reductase with GAF domain